MLDIGWSELLVIGVVALIVVGPKDLPMMFRRLGEFTGKARAMAREFKSAMNAAADEAGVKDMASDLRKAANPGKSSLDAINKAAKDMTDWDDDDTPAKPKKADGKSATSGAATSRVSSAPKETVGNGQPASAQTSTEGQAKAAKAGTSDKDTSGEPAMGEAASQGDRT